MNKKLTSIGINMLYYIPNTLLNIYHHYQHYSFVVFFNILRQKLTVHILLGSKKETKIIMRNRVIH